MFHGIQVYEILENGNLLNAIYTNTGSFNNGRYDIDNEIARKNPSDDKGVMGRYECRYIETNNRTVVNCSLEIRKVDEVYQFTWRNNNGNVDWEGIGLMSGRNHIAVSYIKP